MKERTAQKVCQCDSRLKSHSEKYRVLGLAACRSLVTLVRDVMVGATDPS